MPPGRRHVSFLFIALAAACAPADGDRSGPTVRDSASVVLVDHGEVDYAGLPQWRLGDPTVRIGVVSGDAAYQWGDIQAAGRLSDGTLVALDRLAREVRAFGPDGSHLWTTGREGQGPQEFRFPFKVWATDSDSVIVADPGNARLTVISDDGEIVREITLSRDGGPPIGHGPVGMGGTLLEVRSAEPVELEGHRALVQRSSFLAAPLDGGTPADLGSHHYANQYDVSGSSFGLKLFAGPAVFGGSPLGLWHSDSDAYQISLISPEGRLVRIVRWQGPDRGIGSEDLDRLRRATLARFADQPEVLPEIRTYLRDQPVAESMATFESVIVDRGGRVWIQDYERQDRPEAETAWLVLSPDGELVLGRLLHDPSFEPMSMGEGWMLGASVDDLDVAYLELRPLTIP